MAERIKYVRHGRARQLFLGLESFFQRRLWLARLGVVVVVSAVALLVGIVLFSYGSRLYDDWRQSRLLRRATALLREGKLNKAAQTAQELVARHPDSLPALHVLAEAAEKQNLEEAVKWREQIARLLPTDLESQLNLASAALRFGKLDVVRQALDRVPSSDRGKAAFHVVAGWLASAEGNLAEQGNSSRPL